MEKRVFAILFIVVGLWLTQQASISFAANTPTHQSETVLKGNEIVLERTATVTVRTWLGELYCSEGNFVQIDPDGKQLYRYGELPRVAVLGPYPAGARLAFAIQPDYAYCHGDTWYSTDHNHAHINHNGGGSWTIAWEDRGEQSQWDYNDLYTDITINPTETVGEVLSQRAFQNNPNYKFPYPAGQSHKVTVVAGEGEHFYTNHSGVPICCAAYDFDMKKGDPVSAATGGLVLWVEDSFGSGSCDSSFRASGNVIIIQTESDVHTVYLHLLKGSARVKAGDIVQQGQIIAASGNSGFVCGVYGGYHLHFEWQHHCYGLEQARAHRLQRGSQVGQPTLAWSCVGFPPDAPFTFFLGGNALKLDRTSYTSDNQSP